MKGFHSHLNRENVTYSDNKQIKRVCKDFGIKKVGYYHDLHGQRDTSLLADVFESFQNMSVEINELYCTKISMTTSFKKACDINSRKRYQRWIMLCYLLIWES